MDLIRVGIIGSGYWGPKIVRNFHHTSNARAVVVADLNPENLDLIRKDFPSVDITTDYRDVLTDRTDAVVVATPVSTHHQIAKDALNAGKHVLIEKPLADSVENAVDLARHAQDQNLRLMVGHVFEYNPAVELLKHLVASGELGEILYVDAVRATLGLFQRDINVIWDLAPHDFSILRYILGQDPVSISARGESYVRPGIQDVAYITANYSNKLQSHIRVSWLEPRKQRHMTIVGSRKMVVYDDTEMVEKIKIFDVGVEFSDGDLLRSGQLQYRYGDIVSPHIPHIEPLQAECYHFAESIINATEPRTGWKDGLEVVRCLEVADKSLAQDGAVLTIER